jgi:hypothetical protein
MGTVKELVREFHEELVCVRAPITTAEYDSFHRATETRFGPGNTDEGTEAVSHLNKEFKVGEADAREIAELAYAAENPGDLSVWGVVNGMTSAAKGRACPHGPAPRVEARRFTDIIPQDGQGAVPHRRDRVHPLDDALGVGFPGKAVHASPPFPASRRSRTA